MDAEWFVRDQAATGVSGSRCSGVEVEGSVSAATGFGGVGGAILEAREIRSLRRSTELSAGGEREGTSEISPRRETVMRWRTCASESSFLARR